MERSIRNSSVVILAGALLSVTLITGCASNEPTPEQRATNAANRADQAAARADAASQKAQQAAAAAQAAASHVEQAAGDAKAAADRAEAIATKAIESTAGHRGGRRSRRHRAKAS